MVNDSEQYVYDLCKRTFLSLWSYPNPVGKNGKELCDILVVCGDDVVIISVKDIQPTMSGDTGVDWRRWLKRAIDSSAKQIYGAQRWLESVSNVTAADGSEGVGLPLMSDRNVHRVAVAFGGKGQVPLRCGDFGRGFVHVFDEKAFDILLDELDTISDFLSYLRTKEAYFLDGGAAIFEGHEEDLLAFYIYKGRTLPKEVDLLVVGEGLWDQVSKKPEFIAKKREDRVSYLWDAIIEAHTRGVLAESADPNPGVLFAEPALRTMALEDRYSRRLLSRALLELLELSKAKKVRSRMVRSPERIVAYVFLPAWSDEDPAVRKGELAARCWVVRDTYRDVHTIVGLAVGQLEPGQPLDLFYLHKPCWTEHDKRRAQEAREDLGFFKEPAWKHVSEDEYPLP